MNLGIPTAATVRDARAESRMSRMASCCRSTLAKYRHAIGRLVGKILVRCELVVIGSASAPRQAKQTMRSFYGGASIQGAAMPGGRSPEVVAPGKSSPRGYLDYAARPDTSLAKGVAILRQLPSRQGNGSLRRIACQSCTGRGPFSYTCECSVYRQKRACARVRFKKILYCTLSQKSCGGEFGKKGQKWNIGNHLYM